MSIYAKLSQEASRPTNVQTIAVITSFQCLSMYNDSLRQQHDNRTLHRAECSENFNIPANMISTVVILNQALVQKQVKLASESSQDTSGTYSACQVVLTDIDT